MKLCWLKKSGQLARVEKRGHLALVLRPGVVVSLVTGEPDSVHTRSFRNKLGFEGVTMRQVSPVVVMSNWLVTYQVVRNRVLCESVVVLEHG